MRLRRSFNDTFVTICPFNTVTLHKSSFDEYTPPYWLCAHFFQVFLPVFCVSLFLVLVSLFLVLVSLSFLFVFLCVFFLCLWFCLFCLCLFVSLSLSGLETLRGYCHYNNIRVCIVLYVLFLNVFCVFLSFFCVFLNCCSIFVCIFVFIFVSKFTFIFVFLECFFHIYHFY